MIWHSASPQEVLNELEVNEKEGLANGVVDDRLSINGQNVISNIEKPKFISRFLNQLKNKTVICLIVLSIYKEYKGNQGNSP